MKQQVPLWLVIALLGGGGGFTLKDFVSMDATEAEARVQALEEQLAQTEIELAISDDRYQRCDDNRDCAWRKFSVLRSGGDLDVIECGDDDG